MASLISVVLPEPLGPISTVGGPASSASVTSLQDAGLAGGEGDAVEDGSAGCSAGRASG